MEQRAEAVRLHRVGCIGGRSRWNECGHAGGGIQEIPPHLEGIRKIPPSWPLLRTGCGQGHCQAVRISNWSSHQNPL